MNNNTMQSTWNGKIKIPSQSRMSLGRRMIALGLFAISPSLCCMVPAVLLELYTWLVRPRYIYAFPMPSEAAGIYGFDQAARDQMLELGDVVDGFGQLVLHGDGTVTCIGGSLAVYPINVSRKKRTPFGSIIPDDVSCGSWEFRYDLDGRVQLCVDYLDKPNSRSSTAFYLGRGNSGFVLWLCRDPDVRTVPLVRRGKGDESNYR